MVRIKHKFSIKRRRMDLSESTNIDFNFGSDEDEMAETVAAVAAVQMPDKLPITEQNITKDVHGGLLLSAVKRQREGRSWATQDQPKKPHVESEVQESGEMPRGQLRGKPDSLLQFGDIRAPSAASRLAANVDLPTEEEESSSEEDDEAVDVDSDDGNEGVSGTSSEEDAAATNLGAGVISNDSDADEGDTEADQPRAAQTIVV
ncbi:hypothetical protein PInf_011489 [Phytophthora infestans]|nr:hypothetical protein PInf_011489 [Phytophthora infestans]